MNLIGKRIIDLRNDKDINQTQFADCIKINRSVLNRIELGTRSIRDDELSTIANFFNVSTDYLLGRTNIAEPIDSYIKKSNQMTAQIGGSLQLTDEERAMIEKYRQLPDKAKGKIEERIDMEVELQKEKTPPEAKRA